MVQLKGRPRKGQRPQQPRLIVSFSVPFAQKPQLDTFRENCRRLGMPYSHMLMKKISDINKAIDDQTEKDINEDLLENSEEELEVE